MIGRPKTPTAVLAARGSPRAKLRPHEPRPEVAAPTPPKHLGDEARREWRRVVPLLLVMRVLSKSDRATLALYCTSFARWRKAEQQIAAEGEVVKSPSGYPIQNPWLAISNKAMEQTHKYGSDLGLSPAARTRLHVTHAPEPNSIFPRLSGIAE